MREARIPGYLEYSQSEKEKIYDLIKRLKGLDKMTIACLLGKYHYAVGYIEGALEWRRAECAARNAGEGE